MPSTSPTRPPTESDPDAGLPGVKGGVSRVKGRDGAATISGRREPIKAGRCASFGGGRESPARDNIRFFLNRFYVRINVMLSAMPRAVAGAAGIERIDNGT